MNKNSVMEMRDRLTRIEAKLDILAMLEQKVNKLDGRMWGFATLALAGLCSAILSIVVKLT